MSAFVCHFLSAKMPENPLNAYINADINIYIKNRAKLFINTNKNAARKNLTALCLEYATFYFTQRTE